MTLRHHLLYWKFFYFFLIAQISFLQAQDIRFNHITPDQGFGFGNVWSVLEDHEGFLWFGTEDGLIKYDGYDITNFRTNKSDSTSISANFSVILLEDRYHQIWIGTFGGGLNLYDRNTNTFRRFLPNQEKSNSIPHNRVKTLLESQDGNIWVGTEGGGIVMFDPNPDNIDNIKFSKFEYSNLGTSDPNMLMIRSIAEDSGGNLYIGSLGGVIIVDESRNNITHLKMGSTYPNLLSSNSILNIFPDSKNRIWIGTFDAGIDLFLPEEKLVVNYSIEMLDGSLLHQEVNSIAEDLDGNIWFGTDNGLSKINGSFEGIPPNKFSNYYHHQLDEHSLLSNSIKVIYKDSKNSLWIGSYYGGINFFNQTLQKFNPIQPKPWTRASISHKNVTAFAEDYSGNIWVGTDGGGLDVLNNGIENIYKDDYNHITIQYSKDRPPEKKIKALKFDLEGNLWIGFWAGGLYQLIPESGKTVFYGPGDRSNSGLAGIRIMDLEVDRNNNIWAGTFDQGIGYLNRKTGKFKNYFQSEEPNIGAKGDRFNAILIDSKERIWAGGDIGGLNLFDKKNDCFNRIEKGDILNRKISILSLAETKNGTICIGTVASGIILYNHDKGAVKNYTENSGLPNNVIHTMEEDKNGNIWLGSNLGLSVLDRTSGTVTTYTKSDGLQGNQFNNGSSIVLSNGQFLFGGTTGYNAFYPVDIAKSPSSEKIVFTNFWVNGKLILQNDEKSILTSHLNSNNSIKLHHTKHSFSVESAILDFDFSPSNQYAYFLEGFDTEWQYIGTDRKAVYTNLNPGNYQLKVKITNHDGFWIEKQDPLIINIVPAWWQTRLFRVSIVILFILIIYSIYRIRINFLLNQQKKLERIVQNRTTELKSANIELHAKNDEILAQNEELSAQNEQIYLQRDKLEETQQELKNINERLEVLVKDRTKELESTITELDKTVHNLDRFVYSASHDLSAPLKSVKGLIQIIEIEKDPEKIQTCLDHMIKSITSLENVIKSLLDYSRNHHFDVEYKSINCHQLLNEMIEEFRYWPEASKVRILNKIDKKLIVNSDRNRLKIILHNLIGNAIKYADFKKDAPYIKINCQSDEKGWVLIISDNGIGIENIHLSKIFNMYYRASEASKGSGLGLFIVLESTNKLNGKINVESQMNSGTTFSLSFPNNA